jgi:hypothetical protein
MQLLHLQQRLPSTSSRPALAIVLACLLAAIPFARAANDGYGPPISVPRELPKSAAAFKRSLVDQTHEDAMRKSAGCLECHKGIDTLSMHTSPNVVLGCTDCHGGKATPGLMMRTAHVEPRNKVFWESSANPSDSSVLLNHESAEFIQFVNPGDLRVAEKTCGSCHASEVSRTGHSMMRHGAMLWGAALYNNGGFPLKNYRYGQAHGPNGEALRLLNPYVPSPEETRTNGVLAFLDPLPRFVLGQPGNILRIFEKGGEKQLQLGVPITTEPPGKPLRRLSERGLGTLNRIDPVFLNLQKTRLHDPMLDFMGSNNHPGDYRSSGCTACHVVYANDRSPTHSAYYSKYGHQGLSFSGDASIPRNEKGHPIKHQFTRAIPSSQCMNCHMHQGNLFVNPYLGYTWWDQESDGEFMYPAKQKNPTEAERLASLRNNPEEAAARGLWGDNEFLEKVAELNPKLKQTQFADYHGHGWVYRAVFKKDKKGNLLDLEDKVIAHDDPHKFGKAVHLKDIHLERGMQCVDCHFDMDVHGNGKLYGEPRAATTIECIDCHGTVDARPTLLTTGNGGKVDLQKGATPWGPRFTWEGKRLFQRSTLSPDVRWEVPQTRDTIDPASPKYNAKSRYAKTLRRDGETWGDVPCDDVGGTKSVSPHQANGESEPGTRRARPSTRPCPDLAHDNRNVSCQVCHSSWATSCFGCHLPMRANQKVAANKFEGLTTRNYTPYNLQVVRDDVFQLGIDATYKDNRLAVIRSSSAVLVGSQNNQREWVYSQQQTVSSEGFSGQAYNPHFPHTTSGKGTTKNCADCHLSKDNDNNAWITSLLGFGTGTVNFFGRYAYVGAGKDGLYGVGWTEAGEPQAALGSHLHELAYPDHFRKHTGANRGELQEAHHHHAREILDLTLRGEYLYTANGADGFEVFDVANIDHKGFSERIVNAPVSPLGQRTYVRTRYATSVTLPSTLGIDPLRQKMPRTMQVERTPGETIEVYTDNEEQPVHPLYGFVYITDLHEGLVVQSVGTLVDGDPNNNFLDKEPAVRFNPDGRLTGARHSYVAGTNLYVVGERGLSVISIADPLKPVVVGELAGTDSTPSGPEATGDAVERVPARPLRHPRHIAVQFRYAFISDDDGLKVVDISEPTKPKLIAGAFIPLKEAGRLYVARTFAYVPNRSEGLAIINIENPQKPRLELMFTAGGALNDVRAVQVGSVNASMFALVADGRNGLRVLQLISPDTVPGHMGFSPAPNPKLIATYRTHGEAVAVSRGLDRDRVVDETGNQTVVFGRRGARPFNLSEMRRFLRHENGAEYRVEDLSNVGSDLKTKKGGMLATPGKLDAEPESPVVPPARSRVQRRGSGD